MDLSVLFRVFSFLQSSLPDNVSLSTTEPIAALATEANLPLLLFTATTPDNSTVEEDCRGIYGCYPTGPPWESPERPVSLPPALLQDIKTFFCLHSAANPNCTKIIIGDNISVAKDFDVSATTDLVVLTHGFMHSVEMPWVREMVEALLQKYDDSLRIVTLDWRNGARPPYAQAVSNIRLLGTATGHFLRILMENHGLNPAKTHLVGHSLGAHLFGYAGNFLKERFLVGRITGMDPAGPYFRGSPPEIRLDASDAYLVDILHTDATSLIPSLPVSLGLPEATGHFDFFPNGAGEQIGCDKSPQEHIMSEKDVSMGVLEYVSCSHETSHQYFTSSITKDCIYIGVECSSWLEFKAGRCWDCSLRKCFKMGFRLDRIFPDDDPRQLSKRPGDSFDSIIATVENELKLYLAATNNEHMCENQYRFTLVPSKSELAVASGGDYAKFSLVLRGSSGTSKITPFRDAQHIKPGVNVTWVEAVPEIGQLHSVVFILQEEEGFLKNILWPLSSKTQVHLSGIVIEKLLQKQRMNFLFCEETVTAQESRILQADDDCKISEE